MLPISKKIKTQLKVTVQKGGYWFKVQYIYTEIILTAKSLNAASDGLVQFSHSKTSALLRAICFDLNMTRQILSSSCLLKHAMTSLFVKGVQRWWYMSTMMHSILPSDITTASYILKWLDQSNHKLLPWSQAFVLLHAL